MVFPPLRVTGIQVIRVNQRPGVVNGDYFFAGLPRFFTVGSGEAAAGCNAGVGVFFSISTGSRGTGTLILISTATPKDKR